MGLSVFPAAGGGVTQKVQEFTSTGTFTVPSNCSSVTVFLVGGGGGAGRCRTNSASPSFAYSGAGGGGGVISREITVTPGSSYTVTIGAGGSGATTIAPGGFGGDTTFGSLATAFGGGGGASRDVVGGTYSSASIRATSGGSYGRKESQPGGSGGSGGGAGGDARLNSGWGTAQNSGGASLVNATNTQTLLQGGAGFVPQDVIYSMHSAGIGIQGYGGGGAAGSTYESASTEGLGPVCIGATSGALINYSAGTNTGTVGTNGTANTGNGAGGSAAFSASGATTPNANGANGGSGYARIVYWS